MATQVLYTFEDFDAKKARAGHLCVVIKDEYFNNEEDAAEESQNEEEEEPSIYSTDPDFVGAGIATVGSGGIVTIVINKQKYTFNITGTSIQGYCIKLATISSVAGGGSSRAGEEIDPNLTLVTLDNIAIEVLKTILLKTSDNLLEFSDNDMAYYCQKAYQWAENMIYVSSSMLPRSSAQSSNSNAQNT